MKCFVIVKKGKTKECLKRHANAIIPLIHVEMGSSLDPDHSDPGPETSSRQARDVVRRKAAISSEQKTRKLYEEGDT